MLIEIAEQLTRTCHAALRVELLIKPPRPRMLRREHEEALGVAAQEHRQPLRRDHTPMHDPGECASSGLGALERCGRAVRRCRVLVNVAFISVLPVAGVSLLPLKRSPSITLLCIFLLPLYLVTKSKANVDGRARPRAATVDSGVVRRHRDRSAATRLPL